MVGIGGSLNFVAHRKPWDITWIDRSWGGHVVIRTICMCGGEEHRCDVGLTIEPGNGIPICNCYGECEECRRCALCSNNNPYWIGRGNGIRWRNPANLLRSIRLKGIWNKVTDCEFALLWPCDGLILRKIIGYIVR